MAPKLPPKSRAATVICWYCGARKRSMPNTKPAPMETKAEIIRATLAILASPSSSASPTVVESYTPNMAPRNIMVTNNTRTTGVVASRLRSLAGTSATLAGSSALPCPAAPLPIEGLGSVERDNVSTTVPTTSAMAPASMPATGAMELASAMEMEGPNMKPMSSNTPS